MKFTWRDIQANENLLSKVNEALNEKSKARGKGSKPKKTKSNWANNANREVERIAGMYGIESQRVNTMGVFDIKVAAQKIWTLVNARNVTTKQIYEALGSSYRKSHEKKGTADRIGFTKKGLFFACEIKASGDVLKPEQEAYLINVALCGGIAVVVAEEPQNVKFSNPAFEQVPVVNLEGLNALLFERTKYK